MRTITAEWYRLRWVILERDDFTCQYCGRRAPEVQLQVDHRVPVVEKGTDAPDNLVTACYSCNQGKEYSRWTLANRVATKRQVAAPAAKPFGVWREGVEWNGECRCNPYQLATGYHCSNCGAGPNWWSIGSPGSLPRNGMPM